MIYHVYMHQRLAGGKEIEEIVARNLPHKAACELAVRLNEEWRKGHPGRTSWNAPIYGIELNKALVESTPELLQALLDAPEMDCWPDMTREELKESLAGYVAWFHGARAAAIEKAETPTQKPQEKI